jgi:hypothetical protein
VNANPGAIWHVSPTIKAESVGDTQVRVGKDNRPSAAAVSRQNEDGLRAELSTQRELVSRLHSEINSSTSHHLSTCVLRAAHMTDLNNALS